MFGSLAIVFTFPMAVAFFVVAPSAKLVILMFGSAFVWLCSALVSSLVWLAIVPLKDQHWFALLFAIAFQELFRFGYWKLLKKAEVGLSTLADDGSGASSREKQALVAGVGFSLMSTIMQFNTVLTESSGPGSVPAIGCPEYSMFTISTIMAAAFAAMNIFWSVIMHSGAEDIHSRSKAMGFTKVGFVLITHYAASLLTLNNENPDSCAATLAPLYFIMLVTGAYSLFVSGLSLKPKST